MDPAAAAEALGGEWHEAPGGRVLVVERVYRPGHRHGHAVVADALPPADGAWAGLPMLAGVGPTPFDSAQAKHAGHDGERVLFLDLETTGLAGGAGTCAFLVGCGWFDGGVLRVRQLFLPAITHERGLLALVADLAAAAGSVVTYNGASFDLPLIETRFLYHRLETPFAGLPHVDLLHHARRFWRPEPGATSQDGAEAGEGCRLTNIERNLCGYVREGDVPGFEIPSRYFEFVRTGNPRPLEAVFEHNRLDLVSLALLTARAARLVEEGPAAAETPREALGLGRLYERARRFDDAVACYRRATSPRAGDVAAVAAAADGLPASRANARAAARLASTGDRWPPPNAAREVGPALVIAEALRAQAVLCRRLRRHEEAAVAWRRLLDLPSCPPAFAREAAQALAVHHEHRLRDPGTARRLALRALSHAPAGAWRQATHHRIARLDRKLEHAEAAASARQRRGMLGL